MTVFTQNWSSQRNYWPDMFAEYDMAGKPNLRFLEIGCFEGHTTLWLLENILTDPSSRIVVIDTFQDKFDEIESEGLERFCDNTNDYGDRIDIYWGRSQDKLRKIRDDFDFIYVDGGHTPQEVLTDAVLAWPLLKPGGLMVFDDYKWTPSDDATDWERPMLGVQAFAAVFHPELIVRLDDYQFVAQKR